MKYFEKESIITFNIGNAGSLGGRGGLGKMSDFIKEEYVHNYSFRVHKEDRTQIVKSFMELFRRDIKINRYLAKRITQFLKQFKLTRAEIHAIILNLNFEYRSLPRSNSFLRHMKIDGYLDDKPKGSGVSK